ncbi:MAG TPA: TonB-dependent receptor [Steroidobacteraceae bacterium]|jgi:iron complex outermembrane receptor protein|nr:TonB-dependent receptor [Steroidobacteraceae bacterium]
MKHRRAAWAAAWFASSATLAAAPSVRALKDLSLDQLLDMQVTSVSKRSESLSDAAASIYVITQDALRRSGVTTLAEALRLAPNLQVARADSVQYAISARGFNNAIGNKLLVLIDGRTVYTPLFSGVFWDQQEVMLQDVDRIEVISGPGAALWGANAVNGVINVITRSAADTTGALVSALAGENERGAALRYGTTFGSGAVRFYAKYSEFDHTLRGNDTELPDDWNRGQIGFRADFGAERDSFTVQGDAYQGDSESRGFIGPIELTAIEVSGANLLGRWRRETASGGQLQLQAYLDHSERDDALFYRPTADIVDLDLQYAMPGTKHKVLWGAGYRLGHDDIDPGFVTVFVPDSRSLAWGNLFVQDEIQLREGLKATVGLKLESNDYTDIEVLPSARLAWKLGEKQLLWGSLSRAVRAPARYDRDVRFPGTPPFFVIGGPNFESEVANVVELGYRAQPGSQFSYSVTAFVHFWDKVRSGTSLPVELENKIEGEIHGLEAWAEYRPFEFWSLSAGVNVVKEDLRLKAGSTDPVGVNNDTLRNDPDYIWTLHSRFDLPRDLKLDFQFHRVAGLPAPVVPAYSELDLRLAWLVSEKLELSVVGRNLLHDRHPEYGNVVSRSEYERNVFGQLRWQF